MSLYSFSYFKVPETICNKLDSITKYFWWGHDPGERKLHWVNWDTICQLKREGGLGLKKISHLNQAMLSKQFWKISQHPNSLLDKTLKAKYSPRTSIYECEPKPHHYWIWKIIIKPITYFPSPWSMVNRKGPTIPFTHP